MKSLARSFAGLYLAAATAGFLALAVLFIVLAVLSRSGGGQGPEAAAERVVAAHVMKIVPAQLEPELIAYGEVRSRRSLQLRAATGGRVIELGAGIADGVDVAQGALLFRLDPTAAQAARDLAAAGLAEAEAGQREAARSLELSQEDLRVAEAQVDLRRQAVSRAEDLLARGVGAQANLETASLALASAEQAVVSRRAAVAQAQAQVDQAASNERRAQIALATAERNLADTEVRATFAGRVNGLSLVEGGLVSANEVLGEVIDPQALEVAIRLSTAQFLRLIGADGAVIKAPADVRLDVSGAAAGAAIVAQAVIERAGAAAGEGSAGRVVYARLSDAPALRPGDFVTVTIREPLLDDVALLPATAVGGQDSVLVVGAGDRLLETPVTVLRRQGDDVLIAARALDGAEVVTQRSPLLGAGILIRPIREGDETLSQDTAGTGG